MQTTRKPEMSISFGYEDKDIL